MQYTKMYGIYTNEDPRIRPITNLTMYYPPEHRDWSVDIIQQQVQRTVQGLRSFPKGERAMYLNHLFQWEINNDPGHYVDPVKVIRNGGVDVSNVLKMLEPLSKRLKFAKLPIDMIFCDVEAGWSFWAIGKDEIARVLADPKARANLPTNIQNFHPEAFVQGHPRFRRVVNVWGRYTTGLVLEAIRKVTLASGLFHIPDNETGFLRQPRVVNFAYQMQRWPITDNNGWPLPNMTVDGRSSCPALYTYVTWGSWGDTLVHDRRWNHLIGLINLVRNGIGDPHWRMYPILDWPWGSHPWIWEQLVAHTARTGVNVARNQFYLYWKTMQSASQDAMAIDIMSRHDEPFPLQPNLPQIPVDTDSFETAGYLTTYEDFITNVQEQVIAPPPGVPIPAAP